LKLDAISLGHLDVEFFRQNLDDPYDHPSLTLGPFPGGPSGIFVGTMAKLGARAGIIATVGKDDFGRCIIEKHKQLGVDTSHIIELDDVGTGTTFTSYYSDGSRKFIYHLGNAAPGRFSKEHLDRGYILNSRWLHLSGNVLALSPSAREALYAAAEQAYQAGIPISLDPNLRFEIMRAEEIHALMDPILRYTTYLLPSVGEIAHISGTANDEEGVDPLLSQGLDVIIRKEGERGCTVFTSDRNFHVPGFPVDEVDPTGCGDAFSAAFAYGSIKQWPLEKTALFANAVGAVTATKRGSMEGIETITDIDDFMKRTVGEVG
jgi:sugar/nucleoside kinase (ribokinase family)